MPMFPKTAIYYGEDRPLPKQTSLRAGPLSMVYQDGDLRHIMLGEQEILRSLCSSMRSPSDPTTWQIDNLQMDAAEDSFRITYEMENKQGDMDFFWTGTLTGSADGTVVFRMEGEARSTFQRNQIGLCLSHPAALAGQPCTIAHIDGETTKSAFPKAIAPEQPFKNIRTITHEVASGVKAKVTLEGDTFEMEDLRRQHEGAFKTYCTPLGLAFMVEFQKGEKITQAVTLELVAADEALLEVETPAEGDVLPFDVSEEAIGTVPGVGLGGAGHEHMLTSNEIERLRALKLTHLRVDIWPDREGTAEKLRRATDEARALETELHIALHISVPDSRLDRELRGLRRLLKDLEPPVGAWLLFAEGEDTGREALLKTGRKQLGKYNADAHIGLGGRFPAFLRQPPAIKDLDLLVYPICPQTRPLSNEEMIEALPAQADTLHTLRGLLNGSPALAVGPVTFKACAGPAEPPPGELPPDVDPRQMSLFGAGWTVGSFKHLAEGGADSITYYETTGWRGVMATPDGSPLPNKFFAVREMVFPIYHVLADVGAFAGGDMIASQSSAPQKVEGLALFKGSSTRVLLANFTGETQLVLVRGMSGMAAVNMIDETKFDDAVIDPEAYRLKTTRMKRIRDEGLHVKLRPYAIARIDGVKGM